MNIKEKYLVGVCISVGAGSILYILFKNVIFNTLGLAFAIFFIIKMIRSK
ncbi:MAG: hypothetical protein ACOWWH_02880 [Eubacteriaceae bacterium]